MPVINRFADLAEDITAWRRILHAQPELGFDTVQTAAFVAENLTASGCDAVVTGVGRTGVVGVIHGRSNRSGRVIGLRADMDALPITERSGVAHASKIPGRMHACGHDGHTAMLLGAARYLAETRNFDGTAVVIFQPAEENGGGGREMVADGLMERFDIQQVYGMHNSPGTPFGRFRLRSGPLLASCDEFSIDVTGLGGHAAHPHSCIDTTLAACQIVVALQSVVARNVDPLKSAVVSVTSLRTEGSASNVIPQRATILGTVRTLDPEVQNLVAGRIPLIVHNTAAAYGATAEIDYRSEYPVTVNHPAETAFAAEVAAEIAGPALVDTDTPPVMGAEDFSFMLSARPGAFIFVGTGPGAGLHHPEYDFNDEIIPVGCSWWARLVEKAMPAA